MGSISVKVFSALCLVGMLSGCAAPARLDSAPVSPTANADGAASAPGRGASGELSSYPAEARRSGLQGRVVVRVFIGEDGTPLRAHIRNSSQDKSLDDAALETVMRWRYAPPMRDGVKKSMWLNIPVRFVLESK